MTTLHDLGPRAVIFELLRARLQSHPSWRRIEPELANECSKIPEELLSKNENLQTVAHLKTIVEYIKKNAPDADTQFLKDEMERYEGTWQISEFIEEDSQLPQGLVQTYARIGKEKEGVFSIHHPFNASQLRALSSGVYREGGGLKFYISTEKRVRGKVMAEVYEHAQTLPIVTLCSKALPQGMEASDTLELPKKLFLFGDKINANKWTKIREVKAKFHIYRFVTDKNEEVYLFSANVQKPGEYIVVGLTLEVDDIKNLTESSKLPTKLPYLFAQEMHPRIVRFVDREQYSKFLENKNITKETIFDYPFSLFDPEDQETYILAHPDWYKWLIWAWLLHAKIGLQNQWPLHIMHVGDKGVGKSFLQNSLHAKVREGNNIFTGHTSTMKKLVPSFASQPPKIGYLAEANRFALLDEFFRCVFTGTSRNDDDRFEPMRAMNDMLEHQTRDVGSGLGSIHGVSMTARAYATSNPPKGTHSVHDLVGIMDESFVSRWLVYWQSEDSEHSRMVRTALKEKLKKQVFDLDADDFVSIIDYSQSFHAKYDRSVLAEVFESPRAMFSEQLRNHYDARHRHHVECLLDGIIKARCLFERDMSFEGNERDYEVLRLIWSKVVGTWVQGDMIRKVPVEQRIKYLPGDVQWLFEQICKEKTSLTGRDLELLVAKDMSRSNLAVAFMVLREYGLVSDAMGVIKPYFWKERDENE